MMLLRQAVLRSSATRKEGLFWVPIDLAHVGQLLYSTRFRNYWTVRKLMDVTLDTQQIGQDWARAHGDSEDDTARAKGFRDAREMYAMIGAVDLADPERLRRFEQWKQADGTRAGLKKLGGGR